MSVGVGILSELTAQAPQSELKSRFIALMPPQADIDALVGEGKRIQSGDGITPENTRAFSLFCQAALGGDPEAQFLVSECFRHGRGVQQDEAQALAWLQKSADAGCAKACIRVGIFHHSSDPRNEDEAIRWYEKAAEAGSAGVCSLLAGMCKERGDLLGKLRWDKESALSGDPDSLWDVRTFYEHRDGAAMDLPEAYAWLSLFEDSFTTRKNSEELACFQLNPESSKYRTKSEELKALMSAHQIEQGDQRYQELVGQRLKWIRKKAEAGAAGDQHDLGWCHRDGYGLPQDRAEGVRWWRMAAEQGESRAQNNLGHCLKYAEGTEQNHEEAVSWFQKAAESGSSAAQYSLGHSYCMGLGVRQNYDEGAKWIRKSAEAGDRVAQQNMGFLYENGWGLPQDNAQAIAWYRFSARGHGRAKEEADRLASLMTPAELTKSVELLNELEAKGGRRDEESV